MSVRWRWVGSERDPGFYSDHKVETRREENYSIRIR